MYINFKNIDKLKTVHRNIPISICTSPKKNSTLLITLFGGLNFLEQETEKRDKRLFKKHFQSHRETKEKCKKRQDKTKKHFKEDKLQEETTFQRR